MFDAPPSDLPVSSAASSIECVITASNRYRVPADLMFAVRAIERGVPLRPTQNKDGSFDHNEPGLNDRTLADLSATGWDKERLKSDGCYGMHAAAAWMAHKAKNPEFAHTPALQRAALYHSATERFNLAYQKKLRRPVAEWACYLHHFLNTPIHHLFAYQSNLMSQSDFYKDCIEP